MPLKCKETRCYLLLEPIYFVSKQENNRTHPARSQKWQQDKLRDLLLFVFLIFRKPAHPPSKKLRPQDVICLCTPTVYDMDSRSLETSGPHLVFLKAKKMKKKSISKDARENRGKLFHCYPCDNFCQNKENGLMLSKIIILLISILLMQKSKTNYWNLTKSTQNAPVSALLNSNIEQARVTLLLGVNIFKPHRFSTIVKISFSFDESYRNRKSVSNLKSRMIYRSCCKEIKKIDFEVPP